jgi:peptide/nickel transport system permease protein
MQAAHALWNLTRWFWRAVAVGFIAGFLAFACLRWWMPAPSTTLLSRHANSQTEARFLASLDRQSGVLSGYSVLLKSYAQGNFGRSWINQQEVSSLLMRSLWLSVLLVLPGALLAHALAILWAQAERAGPLPQVLAQLSVASGLLICAIGVQWMLCGPWLARWLPGLPLQPFGLQLDSMFDYARSVLAPTIALIAALFGLQYNFYRALMQAPERLSLLQSAKALGLRGWRLRWAGITVILPEIVSRLGSTLPMQVLGGSIALELVYGVPGIGLGGLQAAQSNDAPVLLAITVLSALSLALCTAFADSFARWFDPRIRHASVERL